MCGKIPNSVLVRMEAARLAVQLCDRNTNAFESRFREIHERMRGDLTDADLDKPVRPEGSTSKWTAKARKQLLDMPMVGAVITDNLGNRRPGSHVIVDVLRNDEKHVRLEPEHRETLARYQLQVGMTEKQINEWIEEGSFDAT